MMGGDLFSDTQRRAYWELLAPLVRVAIPWPPPLHRIDWPIVEDNIGVTLPISFKSVSDYLPAGFLGSGITWTSPTATQSQFRLDHEHLSEYASIVGSSTMVPLYPRVPGYLIFATTSSRIDLAYHVEPNQAARPFCDGRVTLIECATGEREQTGLEIDELLYRAITNKPRLRGALSRHLHTWSFTDTSFPIFRPFE